VWSFGKQGRGEKRGTRRGKENKRKEEKRGEKTKRMGEENVRISFP